MAKAVPRKDWEPDFRSLSSTVCSKHFLPDNFEEGCKVRELKRGAGPFSNTMKYHPQMQEGHCGILLCSENLQQPNPTFQSRRGFPAPWRQSSTLTSLGHTAPKKHVQIEETSEKLPHSKLHCLFIPVYRSQQPVKLLQVPLYIQDKLLLTPPSRNEQQCPVLWKERQLNVTSWR